MDQASPHEVAAQRQDRLLSTLERLLELPATEVIPTLNQAAQLVAEVLEIEKVDLFFHDPTNDTLIALGNSETPMARRQRAIGMDRLPLANGGRVVETFLSGTPYLTGHADQDAQELAGFKVGLGIVSEIAVVFRVRGQHRGVLMAASAKPDLFSPQDVHFLQAVGRWLGVVVDRAELVERMRQEAMEQGQRLAAEELLTVMAHDLRNYLTPLLGRLGLFERRVRRQAPSREGREEDLRDLGAMTHILGLLERVITDLLDVARLHQGLFFIDSQEVNLLDLVQEVVAAFTSADAPIDIQAPARVMLSADPDRLRQVLENLLANAVTHAPKQTPITVQIAAERRRDGRWVLLTVRNQGPGIPTSRHETLFHPFVAGDHSTGLGLGLYLARQIVQAHHGTLTIASAPGAGVALTLALPTEEDEEEQAR